MSYKRLLVTKCLREFLALPDWVDIITPSTLHLWNGYLENTENGFTEFRTGVVWDSVNHLLECDVCRIANNLSRSELEQWKLDIHKEWVEAIQ